VFEGNKMTSELPAAIERPMRKIARSEWARIAARYAAGEALASIARDYHCTPPAIRYIVRHGTKSGPKPAAAVPGRDHASRNEGKAEREIVSESENTARLKPTELQVETSVVSRPNSEAETIGFDFSLRDVMTLEVSAFLVAFEAVMHKPAGTEFDQLRDATDRLLRAVARIRIELERIRNPVPAGSSVSDMRRLPRRSTPIRRGA
jgi:hypothetical protein